MYTIDDLFDKRSVVGARIEQVLKEESYTKTQLCKQSGVSRPTLDKLLAGTLTSETNYKKHISKILECLTITPDMLLGNVVNRYNRTREFRQSMRFTSESVAEVTGISLERLEEIEAGAQATTAELRDIALCLAVSVRSLLGTNFFEPQVAEMDIFLGNNESKQEETLSGFWGHVGILLTGKDQHMWYPITRCTRKNIYQMMGNERMIIPCMNNKLLFLNMKNIKEVILLDDACDEPEYVDWDDNVECIGIPLVVYEVLKDYELGLENWSEEEISPRFCEILEQLVKNQGWSDEKICEMTGLSRIYYKDGTDRIININFSEEESLSEEIVAIYDYGKDAFVEKFLYFQDWNGGEIIINVENVSMLELPLLEVEEAICDSMEEKYE